MQFLLKVLSTCLMSLLLALTSCSAKDGAPRWNYSYNKVPDAIPKVETISKRVNPNSYIVNGKRYFVRHTSSGYDKIGIASWYGTKFHGKLTSTGEKYDMNSMSAANKELPIPCYVEVTNLSNNKRAVVKVNDRGPFVDNRIIDLSYAAAQKLGVVATGTAKVRVRAIDPKRPNYNPQPTALTHPQKNQVRKVNIPTIKPTVYLQIAALNSKERAKQLQQEVLQNALFLSKVETYTPRNEKPMYKVKIGPFADEKTAEAARKYLIEHNFAKKITLES